ncbi:MAG: hypothetical protein L0226_07500 [Acidobacteria bacterium]|nr:hypothetical protein [Acidobacteriota bacterium]
MNAKTSWKELSMPLKTLVSELGAESRISEEIDKVIYRDELFPVDSAKKLSRKTLASLAETYGTAITFRLMIEQLPVLEVKGPIKDAEWTNFQDELKQTSENYKFTLDFGMDKSKLLNSAGISHPNTVIKLFFYPEKLSRLISAPLDHLEKGLLSVATGNQKLLLLIPDRQITLNGEYLSIIGGEECAQWGKYIAQSSPDQARVEEVYKEARKSLKWVHLDLKHLTPLQLKVEGQANNDHIAGALYNQLAALSILYTADHTAMTGTRWLATYTAQNYVAEVSLEGGQQAEDSPPASSSDFDPAESALALSEIAEWVYSDTRHKIDRLKVVQSIISRSLPESSPASNYNELLNKAKHIKREVEGGWTAFIEGKLDIYFSRVRELEQIVDSSVKEFNDQIQTITKTLTDNALASVGIIVGSFIAAVLGDKFNPSVFRYGLLLYAGYLLFFPGIIGLSNTWQRFSSARKQFSKRKEDFGKRLSRSVVEEITGKNVFDVQRRFVSWFWITAGIYLVIIVGLILAAWLVPILNTPLPAMKEPPVITTPKPTRL